MLVKPDYEKFRNLINEQCSPATPYTEDEAIEAFHNLVGFVRLLIEIEMETNIAHSQDKTDVEGKKEDKTKKEQPTR